MKLTLRDLFWLQVFVAIAICWGMEHRQQAKELTKPEGSFSIFANPNPKQASKESIDRQATLVELRSLSIEDLIKRVASAGDRDRLRSSHVYSCCLTELARRKMYQELQSLYEAGEVNGDDIFRWSSNAELLTALRRGQGRPDPFEIQLDLAGEATSGNGLTIPRVVASLQNVDVLGATIRYDAGGDDRSGRHDRWRVRLADSRGRVVEDSNYRSWMGGGIGHFESVAIGEKVHWQHWLDLRSYVKPPPSGLYTLQVIHADCDIANEPNLAGLTVWTSDPIRVRVENRGPQKYSATGLRFLGIGLIVGVLLVFNHLRMIRRQRSAGSSEPVKSPFRRDLLCLSLIMVLILCWIGDSYRLKTEILRHQPDSEADWTIWVDDE